MSTKTKKKVENWGFFDYKNNQHRTILSLMRQANWVCPCPNERHGEVADIKRLSTFLKSEKSPVNKPLKDMEAKELSKIITAFEGIVNHTYK